MPASSNFWIRIATNARWIGPGGAQCSADPPQRLAQPAFVDRLEQVIEGLNLERLDRELQIFAGMGRRNLGADARGTVRDYRIEKADHVNAFRQHRVSEFRGERGVAQHHGHDRMRAGQNVKTELGHAFAEKLRVRFQLVAQFGRSRQHLQNF